MIGHPFDTVKVRLQSGFSSGVLHCTTRLLRNEGVSGFFKGLSSPMMTVPLVNAVVFGAYGQARDALVARRDPLDADKPLSMREGMIAGGFDCADRVCIVLV